MCAQTRWQARASISNLRILKLLSRVFSFHRIAIRLIVRFPPSIGQLLATDVDWPLWSALIRHRSVDGVGPLVNTPVPQEPLHRRI